MRITAVSIKLFEKDKLKAFATITLDEALVVRGIKIIAGKKGLFVAMPNRRRPDLSFQDIAHPVTIEARQELERIVLEAYQRALLAGDGDGRGPDCDGDGSRHGGNGDSPRAGSANDGDDLAGNENNDDLR